MRYSMWDRWGNLTRFRLACEMALDSYKTYVNGFPASSETPIIIYDPSDDSAFKCNVQEFSNVLNDEEALYRTIFPSYVALVEDLARDLIEELIKEKGISRSEFCGMDKKTDIGDGVERYIQTTPVENWGDKVLKLGAREWSGVKHGKRGVVEAVTIRNLCAHGVPVFNRKAINRIAASTESKLHINVGDPVKLNKKSFTKYVSILRNFSRALADGVANRPTIETKR